MNLVRRIVVCVYARDVIHVRVGYVHTLFCRKVSPSIVDPDLPCAMMTMPMGLSGSVTAADPTSSGGACRTYCDIPAADAEWTANTRRGTTTPVTNVADFLMTELYIER